VIAPGKKKKKRLKEKRKTRRVALTIRALCEYCISRGVLGGGRWERKKTRKITCGGKGEMKGKGVWERRGIRKERLLHLYGEGEPNPQAGSLGGQRKRPGEPRAFFPQKNGSEFTGGRGGICGGELRGKEGRLSLQEKIRKGVRKKGPSNCPIPRSEKGGKKGKDGKSLGTGESRTGL